MQQTQDAFKYLKSVQMKIKKFFHYLHFKNTIWLSNRLKNDCVSEMMLNESDYFAH